MANEVKKTVTVQFRADHAEFKNALDELTISSSSTTDSLRKVGESGTKLWATLSHGYTVISGGLSIIQAASNAWNEYTEAIKRSKIEADNNHAAMLSVGKEAFAKIREAAQGYISDSELLKASSKAMSGELGITGSQMAFVTEAAIKLSREGYGPTSEILERLIKSIRTGGTDALKDFGIVIAEGGTAADKSKKILAELEDQAKHLGDTSRTVAQEYERDEIKKKKALEIFTRSNEISFETIGGRLETLLMQKEREEQALKKTQREWEEWGRKVNEAGGLLKVTTKWLEEYNNQFYLGPQFSSAIAADRVKALMERTTKMSKEYADEISAHKKMRDEEDLARQELNYKKKLEAERKYREEQKKLAEDKLKEEGEQNAAIYDALEEDKKQREREAEKLEREADARQKEREKLQAAPITEFDLGLADTGKKVSKLEQYFDRLRESTGEWQDTLGQMAAESLPAFSQAAGNSLMLLASGQEGAGEAFKAMLHSFAEGQSTKLFGIGIECAVLALKDSFMNPAAAATEAAAAAMAFGGAAAMAVVAGITAPSENDIKKEQVATGGAGAATKEGVGYQPANQNVQQNITIEIGHGFLGDRKSLARELQAVLDEAAIKGWVGRTSVKRSA